MKRLGVVSFLNSRPLIAGLAGDPRVELLYDVPARLPDWLYDGKVDAALIPIVDVLRSGGRCRVISDACIACDGETMTVRTLGGRMRTGELIEINPAFRHDFGECIPELVTTRIRLLELARRTGDGGGR